VEGLLQELGCTHNPEEWRIFSVTLQKYSPISTECPLCPHEGNLRKYGFTLESSKLLKIQMENMWRP